jgi:hypothetical protein
MPINDDPTVKSTKYLLSSRRRASSRAQDAAIAPAQQAGLTRSFAPCQSRGAERGPLLQTRL